MKTTLTFGARDVRGALLSGAWTATDALAQGLPGAPPEPVTATIPRVEITGSAIRRVLSETALPVQIISRNEIEKAGVITAAELMARVSANANGLTDGASINVGGDQRGLDSANLRGIGTSSTLVLLNGRRMANFASPGDDSGVHLNNIPAAALEVLSRCRSNRGIFPERHRSAQTGWTMPTSAENWSAIEMAAALPIAKGPCGTCALFRCRRARSQRTETI